MKSANADEIHKAFTAQASAFENSGMNFSKKEYLDYCVKRIEPGMNDHVLEAAAGTCVCSRAMAPFVKSAVCLDMTPAMLSVGKTEAEKSGIENMTFVLGDVSELPFLDNSFDIVFSRLAFHHFPDINQPFAEMKRVLKPGGKLVMIDMEAAEESLRNTEDEIEKMRDNSHIRNLSRSEMLSLYEKNGIVVKLCEAVKLKTKLENWLELTSTPPEMRDKIRKLMKADIAGGEKTGFYPYVENGEIIYDQRWTMVIGIK